MQARSIRIRLTPSRWSVYKIHSDAHPKVWAYNWQVSALQTKRACKTGRLWKELSLLGAKVAESYNGEFSGGMMGFKESEVRAWENLNALFGIVDG